MRSSKPERLGPGRFAFFDEIADFRCSDFARFAPELFLHPAPRPTWPGPHRLLSTFDGLRLVAPAVWQVLAP